MDYAIEVLTRRHHTEKTRLKGLDEKGIGKIYHQRVKELEEAITYLEKENKKKK